MPTFVTGGDGFIGSHLVERLVRDGRDVKALVLYNSLGSWGWLEHYKESTPENLDIVMGDIRDASLIQEYAEGCDLIYHLASLISIPYSYIAAETYVETNLHGTMNVLKAARRSGARVIHTSTSETYGSAQYVPIDERHPLSAQSPYAASKIAADQMALSFHRAYEMPVTIIRPFNTYGPRQSTRAIIPTVIKQLLSGSDVLRLGNLAPTRDFNFVEDTVNAFVAVGESTGTDGLVINACSSFEVEIGTTVEVIQDILGTDALIKSIDTRIRPDKSEVTRLYGDNSLIRSLTGWEPMYGGLDGFRRGLEMTIEWFKAESKDHYSESMI